jgi:hypothetical protein
MTTTSLRWTPSLRQLARLVLRALLRLLEPLKLDWLLELRLLAVPLLQLPRLLVVLRLLELLALPRLPALRRPLELPVRLSRARRKRRTMWRLSTRLTSRLRRSASLRRRAGLVLLVPHGPHGLLGLSQLLELRLLARLPRLALALLGLPQLPAVLVLLRPPELALFQLLELLVQRPRPRRCLRKT